MAQSQSHNKNMSDPLIGREVKDYRFVDKLGGGAFGAVYKAEHIRLSGREVAIKVLHPHIATDESIVERFRREARSLSGLNHPNIVQIIDFDWHDEFGFYLVLEMLVGDALNRVLKLEKRIAPDVVLVLFSHLLSALQEAHNKGIVHRDLKPANLMILNAGNQRVLKVLDFGIASLNDTEHELTTDGTAMGSANYMSPEQALGQIKKIDTRSDLYSCGIILGKCLTGKNVYSADSPTQILWKHIYEPPPLLKSLYPDGNFSQALEDVFARSIAKEKDERFQSASEFLQALQAAMAEMPEADVFMDEEEDDGDRTIFDASYTNSVMKRQAELSAGRNVVSATPTPSVAVSAPTPRPQPALTPAAALMTAASPAAASPAGVVPGVASNDAFRSNSVATATGAFPSMPQRPSRSHSISDIQNNARATPPSPSGMHSAVPGGGAVRPVQIRDRTRTGIRNPITHPPEVPGEPVGESSASFSSGMNPSPMQPTPVRPRTQQGPIRSARRGGNTNLWDDYKWWIIGGCAGALLIVLSVAIYAVATKPSTPAVHKHIDPSKTINPDLTWDKIDDELGKGKPKKRK